MAKPFLTVIIPAYNAAEELPLTLIDADKHLSTQEYSYEILVVNDGSGDKTGTVAEKFTELIKNLKAVGNPDHRGQGAVLRLAMATVRGNWRVVMNANNSTPITEFNKMMPHFREGYDVLVGSNGADFICFSEGAAQQIFAITKAEHWAFNYEAFCLAKKLGYKVKYLAPMYQRKIVLPRKPAELLNFLWEFLKIRWRLWRKSYY